MVKFLITFMQNRISLLAIFFTCLNLLNHSQAFALDNYISPELYRAYEKQQIKTKDIKGNTKLITPNYKDYRQRNEIASEKFVCIYAQKSPAYGYTHVIYTPIGNYIGHRRIMQNSPNEYGYDPIACDEGMPHFKTIEDAKFYYYPQYLK